MPSMKMSNGDRDRLTGDRRFEDSRSSSHGHRRSRDDNSKDQDHHHNRDRQNQRSSSNNHNSSNHNDRHVSSSERHHQRSKNLRCEAVRKRSISPSTLPRKRKESEGNSHSRSQYVSSSSSHRHHHDRGGSDRGSDRAPERSDREEKKRDRRDTPATAVDGSKTTSAGGVIDSKGSSSSSTGPRSTSPSVSNSTIPTIKTSISSNHKCSSRSSPKRALSSNHEQKNRSRRSRSPRRDRHSSSTTQGHSREKSSPSRNSPGLRKSTSLSTRNNVTNGHSTIKSTSSWRNDDRDKDIDQRKDRRPHASPRKHPHAIEDKRRPLAAGTLLQRRSRQPPNKCSVQQSINPRLKKRSSVGERGPPALKRNRLSEEVDLNKVCNAKVIQTPVKKVSLDELNTRNNTADDYEELTKVDKWVRSAPDELYYNRGSDGYTTATARTQTLCEMFEETLLVKAKAAREVAEQLGVVRMTELIQIENAQLVEQRQLSKMQKGSHSKCSKNHSHTHPGCTASPSTTASAVSSLESAVSMEEGELLESHSIDKSDELTAKFGEGQAPNVETKETNGSVVCNSKKTGCPSESTCKDDSCELASEEKTKTKVLKKKKGKREQSTKEKISSSSAESDSDSSSSSDDSSDENGFGMTRSDTANRELERRKKHPRRLHDELWHNDPGLMNDGPVCRCSAKARRFGIRHGFYPGETLIPLCDLFANNIDRLYHYRITISPPKNFLISTPTVINHDGHEYIFEGFSIFSHYKLDLNLPPCKVIRFNIRYDVFVEEERFPESFCVQELLLFETYLFREILELVDLKYEWNEEGGCSQFHLMPRFVRQLPDNGQEVLSMNRVLIHLLKSDRELVKEEDLQKLYTVEQNEWQNFADHHKGTIVTKWGMKPCAIRVDQIDRDVSGQELVEEDGIPFPLIVHFGIRPPQLSYAGNAGYQRAWRRYVKYRHLLSNMPKPSAEDKLKLLKKEMKLQTMRTATNMKRDVTVAISSRNFRTTGICCDLVQHAMLVPVLETHLRFHKCLETLELSMVYPFQNRFLLQLAMTHPSYRENFGTNPDHARNALTNCGIRQPEYGDRRIHYASTRKRGINTLINIMAKFGADTETESDITHNERLEFLGDAVVEFVTSIHLFHIFPDLEEGGLATYRAAIVQNQHLAVLAQALNLDQYMLYAHGSDLCHDSELRHAMANCFEALMGALFLDGGIEAADRVFGGTLFGTTPVLLNLWINYPRHPLQKEEPAGDRHWIASHNVLQKLAEFETTIGVPFNHIRLLARAFTDRSLGYNNLTRGSNQRLEFLGDTVLQLISSEYLYRHFPDHHEGHLSLLRSSLVNNRTQSVVCEDLDMPKYAMRGDPKAEMKTKDKADLLEAFLGALYIDKGLKYCLTFCKICFFPRLSNSITKQEWNDPKSKLQQCCLTLRAMDGREPDIPVYKVTESLGPTNTRTYIVAVYFRGKRLATAQGHSIQEAEMNAAALALEVSGHLFPQLHHQKRIMDKTKKTH